MVKITPKSYFYKSIIQLHVSWIKTDRKYLLVVVKEPLGFRIPKNGELKPDAEPDIIKARM